MKTKHTIGQWLERKLSYIILTEPWADYDEPDDDNWKMHLPTSLR